MSTSWEKNIGIYKLSFLWVKNLLTPPEWTIPIYCFNTHFKHNLRSYLKTMRLTLVSVWGQLLISSQKVILVKSTTEGPIFFSWISCNNQCNLLNSFGLFYVKWSQCSAHSVANCTFGLNLWSKTFIYLFFLFFFVFLFVFYSFDRRETL